MSYIIGVDIGTGSTKAIALNREANAILFTTSVSYPILQPLPNRSEQAPELIWQAFVKCIQRVVQHQRENPDAIGLSSAMHSLLPVDEHGQPLSNMITWADARSTEIASAILRSPEAEGVYCATGTPIHAMSPLCKIRWLKENDDILFSKVHKFISIKEYVWFKLFGKFEIDHSIASATGLFDIQKLTWYPPALRIAGTDQHRLSEPVSTSYARTITQPDRSALLALSPNTVFVIGGSDGCLANLGSNAIAAGAASLTIGTSGAIRVASPTPSHNFKHMTFNYRLDENIFICGGPVNNGGVILRWFLEYVLERKNLTAADYKTIFELIDTVPAGSEGLVFLPYLLGERAPLWNSRACGSFFGITTQHGQKHFLKAVVEGICMALYSVVKALKETSSLSLGQIYASGGFVQAESWVKILADVFNKEIWVRNTEDASSIGAALMAIRAIENRHDYPEYKSAEATKHFKPDEANHQRYQELYPMFERLYVALKPEMSNILRFGEKK